MIKDVTDLDVYKETLRLLPKLYELLRKLPSSERDLEIQAKRAAKSVSVDEVISHLRTLILVAPKFSLETTSLLEEYKVISKRLNTLHKIWRSSYPSI